MRIVECQKCGKKIHRSFRCLHCGNSSEFIEINNNIIVHENVVDDWNNLEKMLETHCFDKVIVATNKILRWMPDCAELFWIRLLAKNHCINDAQLTMVGIDVEKDPDLYNAINYSNSNEREVYQSICELVKQICQKLKIEDLREKENKVKKTGVLDNKKIISELNDRRLKIEEHYLKLEEIEKKMSSIESAISMQVMEYRELIRRARADVANIKSKTSSYTNIYEEDYHSYINRLKIDEDIAKENKNKYLERKSSSEIKQFDELSLERDEVYRFITILADGYSEEYDKAKTVLEEAKYVEGKYNEVVTDLEKYRFISSFSWLGAVRFREIIYLFVNEMALDVDVIRDILVSMA